MNVVFELLILQCTAAYGTQTFADRISSLEIKYEQLEQLHYWYNVKLHPNHVMWSSYVFAVNHVDVTARFSVTTLSPYFYFESPMEFFIAVS